MDIWAPVFVGRTLHAVSCIIVYLLLFYRSRHSNGDSCTPLQSSIDLAISILHRQILALIAQAARVADLRQSSTIGQDEFIFLFSKKPVKLQRLMAYLKSKDMKMQISRDSAMSLDDSLPATSGRRILACEQFLTKVDVTGRTTAAQEGNLPDQDKTRRLLRRDLMSRTMTEKEYLKFHETRQLNLSKKMKIQKFRDWLLGGIEQDYKLTAAAIEVIQYCVTETIAELVDTALAVRADSQSADPVIRLNQLDATVNADWLRAQTSLTNDLAASAMLHMTTPSTSSSSQKVKALTVDQIQEAYRRLTERTTPFSIRVCADAKVPLICL